MTGSLKVAESAATLHSSSRNKSFFHLFSRNIKAGLADMLPQSLTPGDLFVQALEEAAAQAAEEERRRLQTQTELQDRYRTDLEKEKLVGPALNLKHTFK